MIDIKQLVVTKGSTVICQVPQLTVDSNTCLAVIGPNGSGKSTLLRVLSGLEQSYQGSVSAGADQRNRVFVHQSPYLFAGTAYQNATYGMRAHGVPELDHKRTALKWLDLMQVGHLADRRCENLSGGEVRRIALARAFALQPRLLLLDEPFADLDSQGIAAVIGGLRLLKRSTVLIASPTEIPPELAAARYELSPAKE